MEQTRSLAEGLVAKLEEQAADDDGDGADPYEDPVGNGGGEDEDEEDEDEDSEDVRFGYFVYVPFNPDDT